MKTKIWGVLLVLVLLGHPHAQAADSIVAQGNCGGAACWTLSHRGTLTVKVGQITKTDKTGQTMLAAMPDYSEEIPAPWAAYADRIECVRVKNGIIEIGAQAFSGCKELEEVSLADTVKTIGAQAFADCTSLEKIRWCGVTAIGNAAFRGASLEQVHSIPHAVRQIGAEAFAETRLGESRGGVILHIPKSVETIGDGAFAQADAITGYCVARKNSHYTSDTKHVLFTKDKEKLVAYPCGRQADCYAVPDSVQTIGTEAFAGSSLRTVLLQDGLQTIEPRVFLHAVRLREANIPSTVTKMGESVFADCVKLRTVWFMGSAPAADGAFSEGRVEQINYLTGEDGYSREWADSLGARIQPRLEKSLTRRTLQAEGKTKKIVLHWRANATANGYRLYRAAKRNGIYHMIATIQDEDRESYCDRGLDGGKRYYYKIVSYSRHCEKGVTGTYSRAASAKTKAA